MSKSKNEIKKLIEEARKAKNSGEKAVKDLTDVHVPGQLKKDKRSLKKKIRRYVRSKEHRVKALQKRLEKKRDEGAKRAVKWAHAQEGTTENPSGSNWGHPVQDWIQWLGYSSPVPWCGCFAGVAVIREGGADIPAPIRLGYTPYICQDAGNNSNGLHGVPLSDAQPGDLVVFNFGSGGAKHVGVCTEKHGANINVRTTDGNTSFGPGGSEDNGGAVADRTRENWNVICVARPQYK